MGGRLDIVKITLQFFCGVWYLNVLTKVFPEACICSCVQAKPGPAACRQPSPRELQVLAVGSKSTLEPMHRMVKDTVGVWVEQWHCLWWPAHTPTLGYCWKAGPRGTPDRNSAFQGQEVRRCSVCQEFTNKNKIKLTISQSAFLFSPCTSDSVYCHWYNTSDLPLPHPSHIFLVCRWPGPLLGTQVDRI